MLNRGSAKMRLAKAFRVLTVLSQRPDVADLFGLNGPEDPELVRGWSLYRQALHVYLEQKTVQADALYAMGRCRDVFQAAKVAQARLTALARLVVTAPAARDRLVLNGRRAEGVGDWRLQAEVFHANLTDDDRLRLAGVGVQAIELERVAALLPKLAEVHAACIAAKAEARAATDAKVVAFRRMAALISLWGGIARALEAEHPHIINLLCMRPDGRRRNPSDRPDQGDLQPFGDEVPQAVHEADTQQNHTGELPDAASSTALKKAGPARDQAPKAGRHPKPKRGRRQRERARSR